MVICKPKVRASDSRKSSSGVRNDAPFNLQPHEQRRDAVSPHAEGAAEGIQRVETTAILEDNHKSRANFLAFDHIQHKRRRAYVKEL